MGPSNRRREASQGVEEATSTGDVLARVLARGLLGLPARKQRPVFWFSTFLRFPEVLVLVTFV